MITMGNRSENGDTNSLYVKKRVCVWVCVGGGEGVFPEFCVPLKCFVSLKASKVNWSGLVFGLAICVLKWVPLSDGYSTSYFRSGFQMVQITSTMLYKKYFLLCIKQSRLVEHMKNGPEIGC
jgi:hypothetical protein